MTTTSQVAPASLLLTVIGLGSGAFSGAHVRTGVSLPLPGESAEAVERRLMGYNAELNAAGLSLFHNFFRVAAAVSLVVMVPALLMRGDSRG